MKTQRGAILFIALIMLVAMSLAGIALVRAVDTTVVIAGNMAFKQGTMMATDVGVETASQIIRNKFDADLTENDDAAQNYSATYDPALNIPAALTVTTANALTDVSATGNNVRYWIERMCRSTGAPTSNGCVREEGRTEPYYRVTARVDGPRGTLALVQSTVQTPAQFIPKHALLSEGRLQLTSSVTVGGQAGNVHSNTRVEIGGTTTLTLPTGTVSAVGSHAASGGTQGVFSSGTLNGGLTENAEAIIIPEIIPADYKEYADVILHSDGSVTNRAGTVLMTGAEGRSGVKWLGWTYVDVASGGWANALEDPGTPPTAANIARLARWELQDDISWSSGLIYVEGHAHIVSTPGTACTPAPCVHATKGPNPWVVSVIAAGDMRFNNGPNVQDYRNGTLLRWIEKVNPPPTLPLGAPHNNPSTIPPWPGLPSPNQAVQNLFLVAGLDLMINGTLTQTGTEGLITAREQFVISSSVTLSGSLVVSNRYSASTTVTQNVISGTTTINYSGNLAMPPIIGGSRRVSWRMVQ